MSPMKDRITSTATGQAAPTPFRRPSGRASFPRRMTLDLDTSRYDWLRHDAYEARLPAAAILRAAIDLLREDEALAQRVLERAHQDNPSD